MSKVLEPLGNYWGLYIEGEAKVVEGVLFLNDPQVFTGREWLFDPAKERKP